MSRNVSNRRTANGAPLAPVIATIMRVVAFVIGVHLAFPAVPATG
nr:putative membrane protein [Rhodococcus sp. JVH1]